MANNNNNFNNMAVPDDSESFQHQEKLNFNSIFMQQEDKSNHQSNEPTIRKPTKKFLVAKQVKLDKDGQILQEGQSTTRNPGSKKNTFIEQIDENSQGESDEESSIAPSLDNFPGRFNQQDSIITNTKTPKTNKSKSSYKTKSVSLKPENPLVPEFKKVESLFQNAKQTLNYGLDSPGAKYDKNGNIIQRSLIGKEEWFQRCQEQNKKDSKLLNINMKQQSRRKSFQDNMSVRSQLKINTKNAVNKHIHSDQRVTKHQVLREVDEIKERIKKNQEKENEELQKLQYFEKVKYTNNERIIKKHEQQQEKWINQIENQSKKLNRDVTMNQLARADQYWVKKQSTGIFDDIKSDFERFGSNVWINMLRKDHYQNNLKDKGEDESPAQSDNKQKHDSDLLRVVCDVPDAFKHSQVGGRKDQVQIIKRPHLTDPIAQIHKKQLGSSHYDSINYSMTTYRYNNASFTKSGFNQSQQSTGSLGSFGKSTLNINRVPFSGLRSDQYYCEKISNSKLYKYEPLFDENTDYDSLAVVGNSKLDLETDILNKYDNYSIFKKMDPNEEYDGSKTNRDQLSQIAAMQKSKSQSYMNNSEHPIDYSQYAPDQKVQQVYTFFSDQIDKKLKIQPYNNLKKEDKQQSQQPQSQTQTLQQSQLLPPI